MHRWYNKNVGLTLDITTHCNAKCPQCARTDHSSGGLKRYQRIPLVHWSLEDIQKVYTKEQLETIKSITFSPSWGDPMMNPQVYEIIDYLLENLPDGGSLKNVTNGSMRDEDYWWKLGGLAVKHKTKLFITTFDIDGVTQEMHSHYRRNTVLQKTLDNMKAFSDNGKSISVSQTIVFKHNQDYMEDIEQLAKQYGSKRNTFIKSDRFDRDKNGNYKPYLFLDENNQGVYLEWADKPWKTSKISQQQEELDKQIVCKWAVTNNLNINFDGQVWPCCYIGAIPYSRPKHVNEFNQHPLIEDYNSNRLMYNVKHTPIKQIIEGIWYTKTLQESISNNPLNVCQKQCSTQIRSLEQFQLRTSL